MKNLFAASLAIICLSFTVNFAQSRSASPDINNQKANKRPPQSQPDPTPQPAKITNPEDLPNTTNIELVNDKNDENSIDGDEEVISIDTKVVSVPVKILDRKGRFIGGLKQEDFQISENNVPQEIAYFSNEQQPFTVALVLDMSYSSTFKIEEIHQAAISFIAQLRKDDKVMVVSFDEEVHILTPPTNDRAVLQRAIQGTRVASGTSLYEAVDFVINKKFNKIGGRKAIVLFTDGVDTTSRRSNDLQNISDVQESDVLIYPIQYDTFNQVQAMKNTPVIVPPTQPSPIPSKNKSPFPFPIPTGGVGTPSSQGTSVEDYRRADEYLKGLADYTGGRIYQASTAVNLTQAFAKIASELREYYSIGYYPKEEGKAGARRKIKVRVAQDNLVVRARDSYIVGKKDKN